MKRKKDKKEKPIYIDDGSTVFDMSGLNQTKKTYGLGGGQKEKPVRTPGRWKAILRTYFDAVRMMLLPMLVFLGAICVIFLILYFLF